MKHILTACASGLVFGLGLILSGMTDPAKVIGFLDLAGNFNPALAFVMAGAIPVAALAFRLAARRGKAAHLPATGKIDQPLLLGALTFGAGWGLAGYCPGPALASLATGGADAGIFVAAMLGGMLLFELAQSLRKRYRAR